MIKGGQGRTTEACLIRCSPRKPDLRLQVCFGNQSGSPWSTYFHTERQFAWPFPLRFSKIFSFHFLSIGSLLIAFLDSICPTFFRPKTVSRYEKAQFSCWKPVRRRTQGSSGPAGCGQISVQKVSEDEKYLITFRTEADLFMESERKQRRRTEPGGWSSWREAKAEMEPALWTGAWWHRDYKQSCSQTLPKILRSLAGLSSSVPHLHVWQKYW